MDAIYNEIEPFAADWLERLAERGHIAPGRVERRSIADLSPADVAGPGQRHFFAGIGGWSYALRLAGVPDDADVWTGSCPCQPFSPASRGRARGFDDEKHLWPAWARLIGECRPAVVLGEQVARGGGTEWLSRVADYLKRCGYVFAAANLCGSLLGFPRRERLYFAAYAHANGKCDVRVDAALASIRTPRRVACEDGVDVHRMDAEGDGFPSRMGQRSGYGNAIVPQVAATFIEAALDAIGKG